MPFTLGKIISRPSFSTYHQYNTYLTRFRVFLSAAALRARCIFLFFQRLLNTRHRNTTFTYASMCTNYSYINAAYFYILKFNMKYMASRLVHVYQCNRGNTEESWHTYSGLLSSAWTLVWFNNRYSYRDALLYKQMKQATTCTTMRS